MDSKSIAETLRIKPHTTVWSTRPEYLERIWPLPDGVTSADSMEHADTAILFVEGKASAKEVLNHLKDSLDAPRVLWVAFPGDDTSGIDRESLGSILEEYKRRPVSRQVQIDDFWAAIRFGRMKPGEQLPTSVADRTNDESPSDLSEDLSAPALRALAEAGYTTLVHLTKVSEKELLTLHGMGPKGTRKLREALVARGQAFAGE